MLSSNFRLEPRPVRIGGYQTRLLERSGPADLTLLFIHGWADSADTYRPLMAALADVPARLVAVDLPQFGAAEDLAPGPQLPQFVAFVRAALAHFGARGRLLPIAQSLGGRALLMALNQPLSLDIPGCVVIGPAPLDLPAWQKMLVRNGSLAPSASRLGDELSWEQQQAEFLKSFKRTCLAQPELVADSVYADYLSHYTPARIARHMSSLISIGNELQQPLQLSALQLPVEMIWGELDRMAPLKGADRYVEALAQVNLTVFKGCGHHAHLERVAETAGIVRRLIP
ncbi:MAG: Pimeloyl-ACP methyl ester carboxylesterase [Hydrocarboniphaga sp.]|uniref:alpha/beta fold hydrolase n=1 Tax=Hydrocarboniphaga sp. TaxID=2033016 RepID=UPI002607F397|nr:alpha/beta fold hydrolase [Hydrocarboniphaga sp.]MDB5968102.1 Pimeloyl-ACP methyl ester carboxylesterase [Hydrocarboniphaga sp.]